MFNLSTIRRFAITTLFVALAVATVKAQTTAPATQPRNKYHIAMTKTGHFSELGGKVNAAWDTMVHLMLDNRDDVMNPEKRKDLLLKVKPVAEQLRSDARALSKQEGEVKVMTGVVETVDAKVMEYLILLDDDETMRSLQADINGTDISKAMAAEALLIARDWTFANGNKQKQIEVIDALEKLDRAHPDSAELADATFKMRGKAGEAGRGDLHDRLVVLLADVMDPKVTKPYEGMIRIANAGKAMAANLGKPFVLSGKTADGKDFSTADWKGKVVLVDFWATWCGPCIAALPEIQKFYSEHHEKGLEIVGVSNDFSLADLQKFTAKHNMPWPQLFDADAAAKQTWNPVTLGLGVNSIPRLFVIDRAGNLVSINAKNDFKELITKALAE